MRKVRSFATLGVSLMLTTLIAACGSTSAATPGTTTCSVDSSGFHLVNSGKLTVASDASFPPQEFKDPTTQQIVGSDVDLAKEMSKRLCLTPDVQNVSFDAIQTALTGPALGQQRYDLSFSAWTITDNRKSAGDMIPYFQAGESILVPTGNPKHIKVLTDLCGLNVAVQTATNEETEIDNVNGGYDGKGGNPTALNLPGGACEKNPVKPLMYVLQTDVIQQLVNGRADAAYQDSPVTDYFLGLNTGKLDRGPTTVAASPEGIFVRKDNSPLENALIKALGDMRADGTYKKILDKWHVTSDAFPAL